MHIILRAKKLFYWIDSFLYKIPIIGKRAYLRQLSKFIIAGGLVTLVDFAIYICLTRSFLFWQTHYLWANFISMSIGAVGSFILNKNWVFKNKKEKIVSQYMQFWIIGGIGGMVLFQILFAVFVEIILIYDILAKVFAAIIVLFLRFIIQKFWIFK